MSARRLLDHFVRPADAPRSASHGGFVLPDEAPHRACADPAPRTPTGVALLASGSDALALGAALGLALIGARRAPSAVVCAWTAAGRAPWRAPAHPAARRLALALTARGLVAHASGRLAFVTLEPAADDAALQAQRAVAVAGSAASVLALGGPRTPAFDALLAQQDLVVVATTSGADQALAALALAGVAALAARTSTVVVGSSVPGRTWAIAGVALLPSARRLLAGTLEQLP